jgi:hypothetical protein
MIGPFILSHLTSSTTIISNPRYAIHRRDKHNGLSYFDTILKYFIICKKNSYITEKKERKTGRKGEGSGKRMNEEEEEEERKQEWNTN